MRIAQIAPLFESVPPQQYGGTERVVSYLTEELVKAGHEVTLFAAGDSVTSARLVAVCSKALRLHGRFTDPLTFHFLMMEEVVKRRDQFDILHTHIDAMGFIIGRRTQLPTLGTLHGRLDIPEHRYVFREYREFPLVSISQAQRRPLPEANWLTTIYHGLPEHLYGFRPDPGDYLVYIGRISPEKKVDSAIEIAIQAGLPLKIGAKVDALDREYFLNRIEPLLKHPLIEFVGEVDDRQKARLVGGALAFLHPVDWPEPFGLAMIEAMACGTPVIARNRGSIPEVIDHGVTGFVFEHNSEAVFYLKSALPSFSRLGCRRQFERRFGAARMAGEYLRAYETVLASWSGESKHVGEGDLACLKLVG